ncbi:YlbF family regulator [Halapricum hydrolyticum]|uniref:YlbF family regulator n=1 Tax=Halapricum hydrolyticum TaxID=2979991 RepID=A0AAE3IH69_9EURY|nr:YlbF family regulator [Halapricum hydrolyticum]MCU4719222.1 YlbF family regulator [Halapricum hydrolyticum]MCU4728345.1 YlbF family regulator [Halapricum hydrolyticum]
MSVDTEGTTAGADAETLATALGEAITDLPEYQAYLDAKADVEADEAAQQRIEEFEQVREEYMVAKQTNRADESDLDALKDAKRRLHALPVMKTYLRSQAALESRLQELDELISEPLAVDFGEQAGSCCQD